MNSHCIRAVAGHLSRRSLLLAAASSAALGSQALAQLPSGPITIVVPSSPGSGPDVIARLVGQHLTTLWNTAVIVDNKSGANGIVGSSLVAKAPPDGRMLLLYDRLTLSVNPLLFSKLAYDPAALTGVSDIAGVDLLFVVKADAPYKSWSELLSYARTNPGKVSVGTAGVGSVHHLSLELIKRHYKVDMVDVPYRGIAPAVGAALGGELGGVITGQETVLEHIRAGKLRALAIGSNRRSPLLPEVPTLAEV
ncbi:MAG: Bug family tripartite tricarboxylate transporter substrate binding protein, partial [Pseudomonadales bacterium]